VVAGPSVGGLIDFIADQGARASGAIGLIDREVLESGAEFSNLSFIAKKDSATDADPLHVDRFAAAAHTGFLAISES
jgi:hypothetical protein